MSDLLTFQDPLAEAEATINILVGKPDDAGQRPVTIAAGLPGQAPVIITAVLDEVLAAAPIRQAWLAYGTQAELAQAAADEQVEAVTQDDAEEAAAALPTEKPKPRTNLDALF